MAENQAQSDEERLVEDLRQVAFADDAAEGIVTVEHKGHHYEVRPPTIDDQKRIQHAAKDRKSGEMDHFRVGVKLVIACTYAPGTQRKVFTAHDEDGLLKRRAGKDALVTKLLKAVKQATTPDEEAIDADFDDAPTSSSST